MQTALIKFRATRQQKARLEAAAEENDTTVSAMLRVAATHLAAGRPVVRNVATEFANVRRMANAGIANLPSDNAATETEFVTQIRASMEQLKTLADRYLDDTRC